MDRSDAEAIMHQFDHDAARAIVGVWDDLPTLDAATARRDAILWMRKVMHATPRKILNSLMAERARSDDFLVSVRALAETLDRFQDDTHVSAACVAFVTMWFFPENPLCIPDAVRGTALEASALSAAAAVLKFPNCRDRALSVLERAREFRWPLAKFARDASFWTELARSPVVQVMPIVDVLAETDPECGPHVCAFLADMTDDDWAECSVPAATVAVGLNPDYAQFDRLARRVFSAARAEFALVRTTEDVAKKRARVYIE